MTVDGYIGGPNGEMDWMTLPWTDDINNYVDGILEPVDTIVLGRKLAEGFIPYWVDVAADPDNPEVESGKKFTDTPTVVFSKTLEQSKWDNTIIANGDLVAEITKLKEQEGQDIYACGGATFASALIKHGLIDDYYLFVNPVAIGNGLPIFQQIDSRQNLTLVQLLHTQPEGYLAVPPTGHGPGVLVLHAWWGLNDTIKGVCDRLAQEGFIAFAPDLYHGQIAETIAEAEHLSNQAQIEPIKADIAAAVDLLCRHTASADCKLGVVGFSFGAYFALELAVDEPDRIRAVVLFYGTGEDDHTGSQAAYLGHFAANDDFEPTEVVVGLETSLKAAGRPVTIYRYEGVGHWFFESDRTDAYNQAAAELAWERTITFLNQEKTSLWAALT